MTQKATAATTVKRENIQDIGQKIGGAAKDRYTSQRDIIEAIDERSQISEKYTSALLEYLAGNLSCWDIIDLFNIPDDSSGESSDILGLMNRDYEDIECNEDGLTVEQ